MSGVGGEKLPMYASTSSSSSSSKPRLRSPSVTTGGAGALPNSPSTRYRPSPLLRTSPSTSYPRYSDDGFNEHSRLHNADTWENSSRSANPYANGVHTPRARSNSKRHSKTSSDGSHTDYNSTSPFSSLLNQRRRWWFRSWRLRRCMVKPRHVLLYLLPSIALALLALLFFYEPHIEIKFYSRRWIQDEVDPIPPLSSCFQKAEWSKDYNVTERIWGKTSRWDVHSGVDMQKGLDCYDFAGLVKSREPEDDQPIPQERRTIYHSYWRKDLVPFGPRQEYMLKSFFATQPIHRTRLILWSNGNLLSGNPILQGYMRRFPDAFVVKEVDMKELARGTALEGSDRLERRDEKAWVDGDLLRLLLLWNFGGVWVDMDSLLTRSLEPLLEHEFVTQWDCYNKPYTPLNGALMHFHAHSPYLCEAFHIMATSTPPRPGSTDWGSLLYIKLWRRLVKGGIPPFKILPWCFSDGRSCRIDNRLPDPFRKDGEGEGRWIPTAPSGTEGYAPSEQPEARGNSDRVMSMEEGSLLDEVLQHKVFSVHLHNQWDKSFPNGGWVERLLLKRHDAKVLSIIDKVPEDFDKRAGTAEGEQDATEKTSTVADTDSSTTSA